MVGDGFRLGVDFGTSSTAAVLAGPGGQTRPLLFDGSPLLPSAVFADTAGDLLTGRDAVHSARTHPERFEPTPKRRVDDGTVLLGDRSVPVVDLIAAVLRRVAAEAALVAGEPVRRAVLTHPASWGTARRDTLRAAAAAVFAEPALVPEPVAAASYFLAVTGGRLPDGATMMVYDLGAGTFDATVVRRSGRDFDVLATGGLDDVGGLDIDAAIVASLAEVHRGGDETAWARLLEPATAADRRAARTFWDDVRAGKEMLSRAPTALLHVPLADEETLLSREQIEQLAGPILERTVAVVPGVLAAAGVPAAELAGLFLVGGASRMPLVGTLLHQRLGVPPTLVDQPELAVASGSVDAPIPAPDEAEQTGVAPEPVAPEPVPARPDPAEPVPARPGPAEPVRVGPVTASPDVVSLEGTSRGARSGEGRRRFLITAGLAVLLGLVGLVALRWERPPQGAPDGPPGQTGSVPSGAGSSPASHATTSPLASPAPGISQVPRNGQEPLQTIVLSSDGRWLAAVSDYAIQTYALPDLRRVGRQLTVGKETYRVPGTSVTYREDFGAAAFSPDGRLVATHDQGIFGHVQVWDVASGRRLKRLSDSYWASCLAFSPRKNRLAVCAGHDESVRLWSVPGWGAIGRMASDDPAAIRHVAFSPNGKILASDGGKGTILLWDTSTRKRLAVLRASTVPAGMVPISDPGVPVEFSPDGRTLATGGIDGTVRLWDVASRKQVAVLGTHAGRVRDLAFAPDGTLASSGADDRELRLWDVANRRQYGPAVSLPGPASGGASLAFTSDSRTLYVVVADTVQRWDMTQIRRAADPAGVGS